MWPAGSKGWAVSRNQGHGPKVGCRMGRVTVAVRR